jgi:hypothetical protein
VAVSLFEYDYDDLARQIQTGLERIGVNFLRRHGARFRGDAIDFHGLEQIDLELSFGPHRLELHQVGRPRGVDGQPLGELPPGIDEEFASTFDGWPSADQPRQLIAAWLANLPLGEAAPEQRKLESVEQNPFAAGRQPARPRLETEDPANPFLRERPRETGRNPFAQTDRDDLRRDALRRLKDD